MSTQPSDKPEPWQIALEQLRAEYARLVPWQSPTELQDEAVWAYGRCEQTLRKIRQKRKERTMNQDEHERQVLLAFLDWLLKQGFTICYQYNPQDTHSYVPTSRTEEQIVRDFLFSKSTK